MFCLPKTAWPPTYSLADTPEFVNSDPYGKGWIVKCSVANTGELDGLMDAAAYQKYCEERG